jgi:3-isopropylmalate/(R)-2-methylmalate dehydratase small subunit
MQAFSILHSKIVLLPVDNIDTDQIIPARFLKTTNKDGLGDNLFSDWRYHSDGTPNPDFILNKPGSDQAQILMAGDNFGCGSSREHAPWALVGFGFKAVVSTSFADIFRNNALKNGLLPVEIDKDAHRAMLDVAKLNPDVEFTIDLDQQCIIWPEGHEAHFPIDPFSKSCLMKGVDELGYILGFGDQIRAFEKSAV